MIRNVRTTIFLDDRLGERARRRARRDGLSLSALVARALDRHLTERLEIAEALPFELVTVGGEGTHPGIDLDRSSMLVVLEDEELFRTSSHRT